MVYPNTPRLFPFAHGLSTIFALLSALDLLQRYFLSGKIIMLESQHANFQKTTASHASSRSLNIQFFWKIQPARLWFQASQVTSRIYGKPKWSISFCLLAYITTRVNCGRMLLFLGGQRLYFCAICGAVHLSMCAQAANIPAMARPRCIPANVFIEAESMSARAWVHV